LPYPYPYYFKGREGGPYYFKAMAPPAATVEAIFVPSKYTLNKFN
jgi:hypothetical protein